MITLKKVEQMEEGKKYLFKVGEVISTSPCKSPSSGKYKGERFVDVARLGRVYWEYELDEIYEIVIS